MERMSKVIAIDTGSLTATVQAGVLNADLKARASEHGLWYAPDPASFEFSTIGGNIATNAGGLCCTKYGVTRDARLGVELVVADGRANRIGRRTRKGVAGYDLTSLVCGSEGTLGVVTEATLRLLPRSGPTTTLAAEFAEMEAAGEVISTILRGRQPSLFELMDRSTVNAVEDFRPMGLNREAAALVFACSDVGGGLADVTWMAERCEDAGATLVVVSEDEAEGRMMMAARRLAYTALEHLGLGTALLDDVGVPAAAIPQLLTGIEAIGRACGLTIATFGHAGDGNMHPTIVYDRHDPAERAAAMASFSNIVKLALKLEGTITGEHGVGLLKRGFLDRELGDANELNRAIKHAFDPNDLFNPGKAL